MVRILGILLILAGVLGLIYGSFSFTKGIHSAKLGPMEFAMKDKQRVQVPTWAGVAAVAIGGRLILFGSRRQRR